MTTPQALHHALLRPCVLHVLRAAGFHSTRSSVLDAFTDLAAKYMSTLAMTAASNATLNHDDPEITLIDVRMAMEFCGALLPEMADEDQLYDEVEDTGGVDAFIEWSKGEKNKEIRRIALEGGDADKEDYLTALKKKSSKNDDDSKYQGTILGNPAPPKPIKVEGGVAESIMDWTELLRRKPASTNVSSRRASSELSSLEDKDMEEMDFS